MKKSLISLSAKSLRLKKKFVTLVMISLILSFLLSCGARPPFVTIYQLDTIHGVANPNKVTKYDAKTCKMTTKLEPEVDLKSLHGSFCLSPADAAKWKAYLQAECKTNQKGN